MRYRNNLLLLFLLFLVITGMAQNKTVDSLKKALIKANGTVKVDVLNNLAWEIKYSETGKAFGLTEEALQLAESLKYVKGQAIAYRNLSGLENLTGSYQKSIQHAKLGLALALRAEDKYTAGKLYNILGIDYRETKKFTECSENFNNALAIFNQIADSAEITGVLNNIALLYQDINDIDRTLETFFSVLTIEERRGNVPGLARTYNNVGNQYFVMEKYDKAIEFYQKGIYFSRQAGSDRFESGSLHGVASTYSDMGKADSALKYFQKAIEINIKNDYKGWLANNYTRLAALYKVNLNQPAKFLEYLDKAAEIYKTTGEWNNYVVVMGSKLEYALEKKNYSQAGDLMKLIDLYADSGVMDDQKAIIHGFKSRYYESIGNINLAYEHLVKQRNLETENNERIEKSKALEIEARFDVTRKAQENEKLRIANAFNKLVIYRQRIVIFAVIAVILSLAVIIWLIYRSRLKLKHTYAKLEEQNLRIEKQAAELQYLSASKDKFLSIIAHDLRNPFNAILGFSELLTTDDHEFTDSEKRQFLNSINNSANHASQLLENLLQWATSRMGKITFEPQKVDLKFIILECIEIAGAMADKKNIEVKLEIRDELPAFCDPAMIRIVILNLFTNAIKFTPASGKVVISAEETDVEVIVHISDNGIGIQEAMLQKLFQLNQHVVTPGTENEQGTGLGLLLCDEFIQKNNGRIWVNSLPGEGSMFSIALPKQVI